MREGQRKTDRSPPTHPPPLAHTPAPSRAVVKRADFAALAPEALVKFNMHCAGVDPAEEEPGRKRKRDGE